MSFHLSALSCPRLLTFVCLSHDIDSIVLLIELLRVPFVSRDPLLYTRHKQVSSLSAKVYCEGPDCVELILAHVGACHSGAVEGSFVRISSVPLVI